MCGGNLQISEDMTIGVCENCGSTMTIPRIDSDKKARLFNRANDYRLNGEFDKAYDAYKNIVSEDEQESEAYWGMILSEYGIEYIEDPKSHKMVPTCHRTLVQSVLASTNYKLALEYADAERKIMYQDEAEVIDKLQRKILSVSTKVEPYDVFICYKELDDSGNRTEDSVIAQDIYSELSRLGYNVFFARISLEDKLGVEYEPYIYAALKSARIMLHVTCSGENSDAVWVKNEWSRFLGFMSEDTDKVMIPVIKGISPYDLPQELSKFQVQDLDKLGAQQDLIRGIEKILGTDRTNTDNAAINALMEDKRTREESEKKKKKKKKIALILLLCLLIAAGGYCGWLTLFAYPKSYMAYANEGLDVNNIEYAVANYEFAVRTDKLNVVDKEAFLEKAYNYSIDAANSGSYDNAAIGFKSLGDYKNSRRYYFDVETERISGLLDDVRKHTFDDYNSRKIEKAIESFDSMADYADSPDEIKDACEMIYNEAKKLMSDCYYDRAQPAYSALAKLDYEDSSELMKTAGKYSVSASNKMFEIAGIYKKDYSNYMKINPAGIMYFADNKKDAEGGQFYGVRIYFDAEKQGYFIVTETRNHYEVFPDGEQLTVNRIGALGARYPFEETMPGTYSLCESNDTKLELKG